MHPIGQKLHARAGTLVCCGECAHGVTLCRRRRQLSQPSVDITAMPADGAAPKSSPRRKSRDGGERREHPATSARQARKVMGGEDLGPGRVGLIDPLR